MGSITEYKVRRFIKDGAIVETRSGKTGYTPELGLCDWFNCLYLSFRKDDYPNFNYPVEKTDYGFNYYESSFADLDFHGGITFYEETRNEFTGKTTVKIGCDYQHSGDERTWGTEDSGEMIIKNHAPKILKQFLELHDELSRAKSGND